VNLLDLKKKMVCGLLIDFLHWILLVVCVDLYIGEMMVLNLKVVVVEPIDVNYLVVVVVNVVAFLVVLDLVAVLVALDLVAVLVALDIHIVVVE
jgi:hypothetical protein